jgi:hypothetical protein
MAGALARLTVVALAACASAPAAPARPRSPDELAAAQLARLDAAAGCPASRRVWCLAAGWARGTAADLPADGVLAGLTIGLAVDVPDRELLSSEVTLSAFAVRGGAGLITDVPPENPAERRVVAEAIAALAAALKGDGPRRALAASLTRYLATLPAGASHPLTRTASEWRMSGKADARVRRLPSGAWMAVEFPGDGPAGIFVSLYPDDWAH